MGILKRQTGEIAYAKTRRWLRRRNLKRETESLLISAQSNTIRTNYIKAKIDYTQQNSKYWLCRKLAQKEVQDKARLVGKGDSLEILQEIKI